MKKVNSLISLALLCGCAGVDPNKLTDQYSDFSCEELNQEYRYVLDKRVEAFNQRMQGNNVNLVVNIALGVMNKSGKTVFDEASYSEEKAEEVLQAIRKVMRTKGCGNQGACK